MNSSVDDVTRRVIEMERAALERWCQGDPSGFLEISAPDVVYFDPFLERRLDGRDALSTYYEALRGKVRAARFELDHPLVQSCKEMAVLTFNFQSFDESGRVTSRWNCTEVYRLDPEPYRIFQTHWSFAKVAG